MSGTVFVTGGAGYIGAHCCKAFAKAGWEVVSYDNLSRGWRDFVRWGPLIEGDILDEARLREAMQSVKPDIVAHFAALAYVGKSVERPDIYYRNNCLGTLAVLDAMRGAGVSRLLFSSTCAIYGAPVSTPIGEDHPQSPINPYGWSKLIVERMIADYSAAFELKAVMLRYFNAAGADLEGLIGERHQPETHAIPLAIASALTGAVFQVFGGDFDTKDGSAIRDYVHVDDLADAHLLALAYLANGGASARFNLGAGRGTSVLELIEAVERISGTPLKHVVAARRPGDPASLVATADKARDVLGWRPSHSDIDTIVASAWRWHISETSGRS